MIDASMCPTRSNLPSLAIWCASNCAAADPPLRRGGAGCSHPALRRGPGACRRHAAADRHGLPGRLQQATGAAIVLAVGVRKPAGQGFRLELYAGPEQLSADPVEAATQVNAEMEKLILKHPDQYYWGYERFKAPKGQ